MERFFEVYRSKVERYLHDKDRPGSCKHSENIGIALRKSVTVQHIKDEHGTLLWEAELIQARWGRFYHAAQHLGQNSPYYCLQSKTVDRVRGTLGGADR